MTVSYSSMEVTAMLQRYSVLLLLLLFAIVPARAQTLYGSGVTFPAPLYIRWFQEFQAQTGITVVYQAMGSSGGIKNITARAMDFGTTDTPLNAAEMAAAPGNLHIPTIVHAVAVVYNLAGTKSTLRLTGPVLTDIYLGKITRWDDSQLARLNPTLTLPDLPIVPFHLSNGSGDTALLTGYLSAVSPDWKERVGTGKSVRWPIGLGGKMGVGIAQRVKQNEGSIGYVDFGYAATSGLSIAALRNAAGNFVLPSLTATQSTAASAKLSSNLRSSLLDAPDPQGYPIIGLSYFLVYRDGGKPEVKKLLRWCLTTGQKDAEGMYYVPLPPNIRKRALELIGSMR